jgi:hypothetical protein
LIIICPMKYQSCCIGVGMFLVLGTKVAFLASGAWSTIGSCSWSIHPLFQSIHGCVAANHGYSRIALWSPRFERKNHKVVWLFPVRTLRSV